MKLAKSRLAKVGLRTTSLRSALIGLFENWHRPLSQKDILIALQNRGLANIDRVSIYRNLQQFLTKGLLHEVASNSYIPCHQVKDAEPHSHLLLFCESCNRHEEVGKGFAPILLKALTGPAGFFGKSGQLVISGVCQKCSGRKAH